MSNALAQSGVAVLGGDQRQLLVAETMLERAAWVKTYGLAPVSDRPRLYPVSSIKEAVSDARVIILPISGADGKGMVKTSEPVEVNLGEEFWNAIGEQTLIITGSFPHCLKEKAAQLGIRVFEYAECDEIAIPNAVPTAEGAIQLMMEKTAFTVQDARCLLLGYGRVAQALAERLVAWGAKVEVAARNPAQLARAEDLGCTTIALSVLADHVASAEVIFNTIPALIVTEEILSRMKPGTLIIDLASAPGGVDFPAAEKFRITALLALGLPGKVAPLTAGRILAAQLPGLIEQELKK
ncbi:MAG: dipicolinate synthase subunit DpsA [Firmicutes bacterium]|nr:dipicolinate synthase subunit DpsA [Bacillota bacterium]